MILDSSHCVLLSYNHWVEAPLFPLKLCKQTTAEALQGEGLGSGESRILFAAVKRELWRRDDCCNWQVVAGGVISIFRESEENLIQIYNTDQI